MFASTFIDLNSKTRPNTSEWQQPDYDDTLWQTCIMPKSHGTERHKGEALLLRKWVETGNFEKAYFELESLFPSGELWINGKVVNVMDDSHRQWIDVTKYLKPNARNLIALRIAPFQADFKQLMHHCPTDPNIGWFAGRSTLHLTKATMVEDLYVYATEVDAETGKVKVTAEVTVNNTAYSFYKGQLKILLNEWFPTEGAERAIDSINISMQPQQRRTFKMTFEVKNAKLWSFSNPQLYQVRALLVNSISGKKIETFSAVDGDLARRRELYISKLTDDFVVTTGFRTISQDGGTFRIGDDAAVATLPREALKARRHREGVAFKALGLVRGAVQLLEADQIVAGVGPAVGVRGLSAADLGGIGFVIVNVHSQTEILVHPNLHIV